MLWRALVGFKAMVMLYGFNTVVCWLFLMYGTFMLIDYSELSDQILFDCMAVCYMAIHFVGRCGISSLFPFFWCVWVVAVPLCSSQ